MADAGRWMPFATKVHVFHAKVSRYQQLVSGCDLQDGAIVSYPFDHGRVARTAGEAADPSNQCSFFFWQIESNYSEKRVSASLEAGRHPGKAVEKPAKDLTNAGWWYIYRTHPKDRGTNRTVSNHAASTLVTGQRSFG